MKFKLLLLFSFILFTQLGKAESSIKPLSDNLRGKIDFSFLFFDVYEAKLWSERNSGLYTKPFSLELIYKRDFKGEDITDRSISELKNQGIIKKELNALDILIRPIFPDIKKGDSILASYTPSQGVIFYLNRSNLIGKIEDDKYAKLFLDIWFGAKTSEKKMKDILLGVNK